MTEQSVILKQRIQRWSLWLAAVAAIGSQAVPTPGFAQTAKPVIPASAAVHSKPVAKPVSSKPSWAELTPMQQQALKPLAVSWGSISEAQKRKWLEVSKNYPTLSPADQNTLHSRMNEWVALSPQQRAEARLNFAKTKELSTELTPEEKKAKWQTYQALSPEEKQQLASKATPRPTGAALAIKPVAPQKLTTVVPGGAKPDPKATSKTVPGNAAPPPPRPTGEGTAASPATAPSN
jgi:Protein of unknown function (DUF3106)